MCVSTRLLTKQDISLKHSSDGKTACRAVEIPTLGQWQHLSVHTSISPRGRTLLICTRHTGQWSFCQNSKNWALALLLARYLETELRKTFCNSSHTVRIINYNYQNTQDNSNKNENSASIYSSSCHCKPVGLYLFCEHTRRYFYKCLCPLFLAMVCNVI